MTLNPRNAEECRYDAVSLGEVMLRLDPGDERIATTRSFRVWEGGGEYNVARGLRRCFGLDTAVVTALADNPVGRLVEDLMGGTMARTSGLRRAVAPGRTEPAKPSDASGSEFPDADHLDRLIHERLRLGIVSALAAGATGYVLKQSPFSEVQRAVQHAVRGERYIDSQLRASLDTPPGGPRGRRVSARERDVLRRASLGQGNKEIAASLGIAVKTVEVHKAEGMC